MSKHWNNTEYKHVYEYKSDVDKPLFKARLARMPMKYFSSAKEAALQIDTWLIEKGKKPINVLKKQ